MVLWRRMYCAAAFTLVVGCSKSGSDQAGGVASAEPPKPSAAVEPPQPDPAQPPVAAATDSAIPAATASPTAKSTVKAGKATATAAPTATATPAATAAPTATAPPTETAAATPTATPAPKAFACGDKGQTPCPTQKWMKANMAPAVASDDAHALAKNLEYVAARAPAGMPNWGPIAKTGATKATAGDIAGAKASCKACHDQYKAKYKTEMRDRPF